MTQREFEKMCIAQGFSKQAKQQYVRCLGDGIFQSIFWGFRRYVDPKSPSYSPTKRKSNYISIGIYSLFSRCKKEYFDPSECGGGIYLPNDFCPPSSEHKLFHGIECECDKMAAYGFAALNSINTQEAMLDFYSRTKTSNTGGRIHSLSLVEPFLITGRVEDALFELSFDFTHTCVGHMITRHNDSIEWPKGWYAELEERIERSLAKDVCLWRAIMGRHSQEVCSHISENYERNINWIREFNIPLPDNFQKRQISCDL